MECGNCTACCRDLELHEIPSSIGELCRFCTEGVGCQIYDKRPQECRSFLCAWVQMTDASEELRPDKCGVVFSRSGPDVICGRIPENRLMTALAYQQCLRFNEEGFTVVLFRGNELKYMLVKDHTEEYALGVLNGRAQLHK